MAMPSAAGDPLRCTKARMMVTSDPHIRDWRRPVSQQPRGAAK
jgi:hypothetical protein